MNKIRATYWLFFILSLKSFAQSVGGNTVGAESYCGSSGGGFIGLLGQVGSVIGWQSSTTGGLSWIDISNTQIQQGYSGLTQTTCYRAIVKDGGNPADTSSITCITVYPVSNGGTISGGGVYCVGTGSLTLSGYVGDVQHWQYSVNNGNSWITEPVTSATYTYNAVNESRLYRTSVKNSSYCTAANSNTVSVIISPAVGGSIEDNIYCDSSGIGLLQLSGNVGYVTQWQSSADSGSSWIDIINTTDSYLHPNLTSNRFYRAIVNVPNCNTDTSSVGRVIVNKTVAGKIINNDTTVDYNDNKSILHLVGNNGNVTAWQYADNSSAIWNNIAYALPDYTYTNLTDTTLFRVIVQLGTCIPDTSNSVVVNVFPKRIATVTNYFSPNADGYNDAWYIKGIDNFEGSEVFVYNSFGNEVFYKKNYQNDWLGTYNGNLLPDGTYYYVIKLYNPDEVLKGSLDIMRSK
jgi:gliding motility-associated-like protein